MRIALGAISAASLVFTIAVTPAQASPAVAVASVTDGPSTFIKFFHLTGSDFAGLRKVTFSIAPKAGATAAPIKATYSAGYLLSRSYLDTTANTVTVPVYGLYQSYANKVTLKVLGRNGWSKLTQTVTTGAWDSSCNSVYDAKKVVVPRRAKIKLDYSYFMLKGWVCNAHPMVMDIDGQIRWIGTAGNGEQGSTFIGDSFYLGGGSTLTKIETDGSFAEIGNYESLGYKTFHHNVDPGKDGLLLELNHTTSFPTVKNDVEANVVEVSTNGQVLREWDLGAIIDSAMIAGGDDPSGFVNHAGVDWFHNNAAAYWKQRNELVVSSRENFVIGIGYDDHKIHWILGDTNKAWYQNYPSLRPFALNLAKGTHAPIGQHAVSITSKGNLMLFDNGYQSSAHIPAGNSRKYSAPRQYHLSIGGGKFEAKEIWSFDHGKKVFSPVTSSIYQSGKSFLVDYSADNWAQARILGLNSKKQVAFEYIFTSLRPWERGWNALPIGFENLSY